MRGKRDKEEEEEGEQDGKKVAKQGEQKKTTRATWLGLGEEWGVVRDVRKMIYKLLTPLERVMVERAHGVGRAFQRHKNYVCGWAARARTFVIAAVGSCEWVFLE